MSEKIYTEEEAADAIRVAVGMMTERIAELERELADIKRDLRITWVESRAHGILAAVEANDRLLKVAQKSRGE